MLCDRFDCVGALARLRQNVGLRAAEVDSALLLNQTRGQRTVPHQLLVLLVPQAKGEGLQTSDQGNWLDLREEFVRVVTLLQMVVGDERAQMVDMMKPDIARKPLQDSRQFVERAPLQCSLQVI